jgi:hypothetical protein
MDLLEGFRHLFGTKPRASFSIHPFNSAPNVRCSRHIEHRGASFAGLQEIAANRKPALLCTSYKEIAVKLWE